MPENSMTMDSEKYQEQTALPYTSQELGAFHRFHAHSWDTDDQFQTGLRTITQAQGGPPSFSELLKMRQYYFSTRLDTQINLDNYLVWRKHLEKRSDDPNVPIFKRFDEYDFNNDNKFQRGLPSIMGQLVKDGKSTLDKAALQKEMTKAKAFYYARFIELFDFPAYLTWKEMEKSQVGPACPYAHLWQNKGKGSGNDLTEDAQKFLTATAPVSTGAIKLQIHSPATKNVWTGPRLAKMSEAVSSVNDHDSITSVFWTSNCGKSTQNQRDPDSIIVTKDEKWFTGGLVVNGSPESQSTDDPAKTKELLRQYYSLVSQISDVTTKHQKPVIVVVDGIVSLSAAYLAFGSGAQRVITENATLSFTPLESAETTPNQASNPFAGLYLLAQIQAKAKNDSSARPMPKGVGHYLAFCPDYILRGPDLRKLGLADFFVSSSKKQDIEEAILSVAGCPPPHTTQAVRMALNAEIVYPGPAKIDVWRTEIQECFGDAELLRDVVKKLEKFDNKWSKSIQTHIASLEPTFANLLFEAVSKAAELSSFQDIAQLEYRLAQRYNAYISSEAQKTIDAEDLGHFFEPIEEEETELLKFPFAEWIKEHGQEDEFNTGATTAVEQDPAKACPYLASKAGGNDSSTTVPSDHPNIPGVDFSDPEAAKACPFLSAKKGQDGSSETHASAVPADHPKIPGVDFSDPKAAEACPFLSAEKSKHESSAASAAAEVAAVPADHPKIPGVDFSNPEAMKGCPFLSAQGAKEGTL